LARVCALNNYSLEKMWNRADSGTMPRQHVWGVDGLAARGHAIELAPFHEPSERNLLDRASSLTRGILGHIDQEAHALRRMARLDALYCADQIGLAGLALARGLLADAKFISVVHHPLGHRARRAAAARHDALVCLSPAIRAELERDLPRPRPRIVHLPWGPDLAAPLYRGRGEDNGVVSAGKSNRDLPTLTAALLRTGATGLVYDLEHQLPAPETGSVSVVHPGQAEGLDPASPGGYVPARAIADSAAASIVAIPVLDPGRLTGLTEAVDALALAKPIIATRSPYFPFDIEAIGCGIWVEPGDRDGWARALERLLGDARARAEMGAAGRAFAEREWNYDAFCRGLSELIDA
jgi:glycosyltransferase involved in cell wall biosynthesis